ncbi:MAG: MerR family transcriptional regulator [Bacteroidales bacterium]
MYQIKDVEHLSGIKAHTLRIWEKRYNIIEPKRTETSIRFYDDSDLKRILNIAILNKHGYKISKIADFNDNRINSEILALSTDSENLDIQIGSLIKAMIDFDSILFEKIFSQSIMHKGFQETILKVINPFFKRVGILWLTDNIDPAQEHFISNIIRQKVIVAIDGLPDYPHSNAENFVLYLPDGQWHEMGLLMSSYLIKKNRHNLIYLGSSLPLDSVVKMKESIPFNYIVTTASLTRSEEEKKHDFLSLASIFPDKTIFVGGIQTEYPKQDLPQNINLMNSLEEFNDFLVNMNKFR